MTIPARASPLPAPDAWRELYEVADLLARYPRLGRRARRRLRSRAGGLLSDERSAFRRDPMRATKLARFEGEHPLRLMSAMPGTALAILVAAVLPLLAAARLSP